MVLTLAFRNLFHDRIRLAVTLVGILFSIVLVAVQLGLYLGARKMIIGMIENANAELWVTAYGAKSFEEAGNLPGRERHAGAVGAGRCRRRAARRLVRRMAQARRRHHACRSSSAPTLPMAASRPGTWSRASVRNLSAPDAVAVDRTYLDNLGDREGRRRRADRIVARARSRR